MKAPKTLAVLLACIMIVSTFAACASTAPAPASSAPADAAGTAPADAASGTETPAETAPAEGGKPFNTEVSILMDPDIPMSGFEAVCAAAQEKLGITIVPEIRVNGDDGANVVKTRLASGDMSDLCVGFPGARLKAMNPAEYFVDLAGEDFVKRLDDTYLSTVTIDGAVYSIPMSSSQAGAAIYSKPMYEKYNLEVPKTWEQFTANCEILKQAGETAILGTFGDKWTSQLIFLGDNYNVVAQQPDFLTSFEAGTAKWATSPAALRSFQKLVESVPYYNDDYLALKYDDGCEIMANGEAGHWFILTKALSNIYELYGDAVNDLGVFAVPGDDADNNGLTVWMSNIISAYKFSENIEPALAFLEYYVSDEGLDVYGSKVLPDGPYCIKGYELPDNAYEGVAVDMQAYFDNGKIETAAEFQVSVKGASTEAITQEAVSGQTTAEEAAAKYDDDCYRMAVQLGLDWPQ